MIRLQWPTIRNTLCLCVCVYVHARTSPYLSLNVWSAVAEWSMAIVSRRLGTLRESKSYGGGNSGPADVAHLYMLVAVFALKVQDDNDDDDSRRSRFCIHRWNENRAIISASGVYGRWCVWECVESVFSVVDRCSRETDDTETVSCKTVTAAEETHGRSKNS